MSAEESSASFMEDFHREVADTIFPSLDRLKDIWIRIGIRGQSLEDRRLQAVDHLHNLVIQMCEEDTALYDRLVESVDDNMQTLKEYCEQLLIPVPEITHGPPLEVKRLLLAKLEEVEVVRQQRLSSLDELRTKEGELCEILSMEPHAFDHENRLPTEDELQEIEQHINMLVTEKEQRYRKYCIYRTDILRLLKTLQKEASSSLERDIIAEPIGGNSLNLSQHKLTCMKNLLEELKQEKEKAIKMHEELTKKLSILWEFLKEDGEHCKSFLKKNGHFGCQALSALQQEIKRCQEVRRANIGHYVQDLRKDLYDLWVKCRASEDQKQAFQVHMDCDDFTEDLLKIHEEEVLRWRNTFHTFRPLFVNAEKIGELFQKALEMQHRMTDPNRFHNRGGQLLQEEREKKKLLQIIPKMQQELLELSKKYEDAVGVSFKIDGMSLEVFLQANWELLQQDKENEKLQRKQRKELGGATPKKQFLKSVYNTPGGMTSAVGGGMRSMAFKTPVKPATNTPQRMILRTPNGQASAYKESSARSLFPVKQATSTPKGPLAAASSSHISYTRFEQSLNKPGRDENKRSTLSQQKVLGSKRTPMFTNSGSKRKRFSSGRSPRLNKHRIGGSPHTSRLPPLPNSMRKNGPKLAAADIPFLY